MTIHNRDWHGQMEKRRNTALIARAAGKAYKAHASHTRKLSDYAPADDTADPLDLATLHLRFRAIMSGFAEDARFAAIGDQWEGL